MMLKPAKIIATVSLTLFLCGTTAALAETTGQYIDDSAITTKVKAALLSDEQLKSSHISVETNQGNVRLSGTVATKDQETEAVNAASKIAGVRSVKDNIAASGTQNDQ